MRSHFSLPSSYPEQKADIWRRHHWFPREMISEQRLYKYHTNGVLLLRLRKCFWLVMQREKFSSKSNTQMCVVPRHQYGISAIVSQTSFRREISGGFAKCRLFYGLFLDCAAKVAIFCYRRCYSCTFELLETFLQTLPQLPSSSFFVQKRRSQYKNNECKHSFFHFSSFLSLRLF